MREKIIRYSPYVAMALIAVLTLNEVHDLGIGPVATFLAVLAVPCVLIALVESPAVFILPVLFAPQDKPLPLIPVRSQGSVTVLAVAIALLSAAILFRLAFLSTRRGSELDTLLRNQRPRMKTYLLFAAVVTISYTYTHSPDYGGDKLLRFLTIGALCFLAPWILLKEEKDLRHFALATVGFALVMAAAQIMSISQGSFGKGERVTHIGTGQLIGMGILLVLSFRFFERRFAKFLVWLTLPVLAVGIVATEARGPLLSLLLVTALFSFIHPPNAKPLLSYRLLTVAALLGLATLVAIPPSWLQGKAASTLQFKQEELVDLMQGRGSKGSGGKRLEFYQGALAAIREKPVLGWGVGGWSDYYFYTDDKHYPHNLVFEVGVEEGLVGVVALVAFLLTAFGAARKVYVEGGERYAFLLPLLIYSLGVTMTSGDIDDNRYLWFWCGMALATYQVMRPRLAEEQAGWNWEEGSASGQASPALKGL